MNTWERLKRLWALSDEPRRQITNEAAEIVLKNEWMPPKKAQFFPRNKRNPVEEITQGT